MHMVSAMLQRKPPVVPDVLPAGLQQLLRQSFDFDQAARPQVSQLLQVTHTLCQRLMHFAQKAGSLSCVNLKPPALQVILQQYSW